MITLIKYICSNCNKGFTTDSQVSYCPHCASSNIEVAEHAKSRQTAKEKTLELLRIKEQMDEKYAEYVSLYVQAESILQVLRQYKHRGIITDEEIPSLKKPKLADALKEYRQKQKGGKQNIIPKGEAINETV